MTEDMMRQLRILEIERRPEACLGCGYEHNCSTRGCAVLAEARCELQMLEKSREDIAQNLRPDDTLSADLVLRIFGSDPKLISAAEKVVKTPYREAMAPIYKTGTNIMFVDCADGHGEARAEKYAEWTCPKCGWFVGERYIPRHHDQQKSDYCSQCGQRIDWSAADPHPKEAESK